jgi:hypothetical protein
MSEQSEGTGQTDELQIDELTLLKQRARMMGITFSNNISVETLSEKIAAKQAGNADEAPKADADVEVKTENPLAVEETPKQKKLSVRNYMIQENMKLVRIRVTCLDPKKKEWPGEFLTVANEFLGTVTKFVPFGEATDNGYHVPHCIYKMLKNRKFLSIRTFKDRANAGQIKVEQRWANEFAIEVMEPLTAQELAKLAAAQTAGGNIS